MMALKFLGPDGSGTTEHAVAAIEFAIRAKAELGGGANVRILNASWGSNSFSPLLFDEIKSASNNNMLTVASAGNEGANNDATPHYPSGFNDPNIYILSVAATDNRDVISSFSNFGATTVHLAAPGQDIASVRPPKTYAFESGTSVSTAVVSGAAALVLSGCNLSTAQLRDNLLFSVDVLPTLQGRMTSNGRLNVLRSLQACAGNTPPSFTLKSSSSFVPGVPGGSASTTTISMTPLNGFTSDVNLTASAPLGFNVSLGSPY
jgi:subtilisin family serine protease